MQPSEESQGSLCKLKYIAQSPPECIGKSKMKAGFREREQARTMLGYYKMPFPGFSFFQFYVKNGVSFCILEGYIIEKFFSFEQFLKFICTVNTGTP